MPISGILMYCLLRKRYFTVCLAFACCFFATAQNAVVTENALTGNPATEWDIIGAGDLSIQGFATDISVNKGQILRFKIKTDADDFTINIYRLGYYQGNGARKVASSTIPADNLVITATLPQTQPADLYDATAGLTDCGNWNESAHWDVPSTAVSGIYIAKLIRTDNSGASHIVFIVRDDASTSDLYFQTSDATWQAYNVYGGTSLYVGTTSPVNYGHATKVSYNRPFVTRNGGGGGGAGEDWLFNAEYPMIRWLERNGYDVTYTTNVDADRYGSLILNHKVFMSVGHDEYWSSQQRNNVEAARNAGIHLAFFSGNEVYWKTRWENSTDGSETPYRTLVCYKEGSLGENVCGGKCDPLPGVWTGLWRDGCSFAADGCKPENALSGQISWEGTTTSIEVPDTYKNLRFWRNTNVASLTSGQTATFPNGTLGYEWDWEQPTYANNNPPGRILLSSTTFNGKTHKLSLYRHSSGALVFGAGTVQWSWGLDANHDRGNNPESADIQQATVNLFADMGVQPQTLQNNLVTATASLDNTVPSSVITDPTDGATLQNGVAITITGTATDAGGGVVGGAEVSVDGGNTWQPANGTNNWSYSWTPTSAGSVIIKSRAFDDNGNMEVTGTAPSSNAINIIVSGSSPACPCNIFQLTNTPANPSANDGQAIEVGVKFNTSVDGFITGIRFYKASGDNGTHIGHLWSSNGTSLSFATFSGETASGWQQVNFASPVEVNANTTYIASYHSSANYYTFTGNFFTSAIENGPLKALANGEDGPNGIYIYSASPAFPINTFNSSNYWVDVVFNTTVGSDVTAPVVTATSPVANASGVITNTAVTVTFNEDIDAATVSSSTFELRDPTNSLVTATISYNAGTRIATLTPSSSLAYSTSYTATVKGGTTDPRIKDIVGNALNADYVWTFTTASAPPLPPTEGPGGPILVISTASNPFSRYAVEILRAEGLNEFSAMDISLVNAGILANYDVVILGEMSLSASDVTLLNDWVNAGGTLVTFKPDAQLSTLLGITPAGGTISDKYLLVNTTSGPGVGIVGETIQFHGDANQYTLNGAASLATLYSDAASATIYPAVTMNNVGLNGGKAVAFAYDLARSIVYTRQGNPAWAGQKRDGQPGPIRSDDLFFPDWIDFNKVAIPQADEQQHLLANIITQSNLHRKPLPRFWFLPRKLKAAVVMTGDDHGNNGTSGRFNQYLGFGNNTPADILDWRAIRGTSYIYTGSSITNEQANAFEDQGFEIALHLNTGCDNYSQPSLESDFTTQLSQFASQFPDITAQTTHRTHCIPWSDWATKAKVETSFGIRLNTDYYYWPESWVQDRPGMFTGSGMPMRFADLDGTIIDNYQVTTQMTDESGISYTNFCNQLLDKAIGAEGYYGVFCANMHTDANGGNSSNGSDAIIASAQARQIPVISAKQMLTWLDGRNASSFGSIVWSGNSLSFTISVAPGAHKLQAMAPVNTAAGQLTGITLNGTAVGYTTEIIKGINYAFFDANNGIYEALYVVDNIPPVMTNVVATPHTDGTATITWTTDEPSDSRVDYGTSAATLNLNSSNTSLVTNHTITLSALAAGTTYYFRVTSNDAANNNVTDLNPPAIPLSFTMSIICALDQTMTDFNLGTTGANTQVVLEADGEVILKPAFSEEFSGTTVPAGWSEGVFTAGGITIESNGSVSVNGTHIASDNTFGPGSSIEFTATFSSAAFQNVGISADQPFNNAPWVTIGQGGTPDGNLYARASNNASVNLGNLLGSSHRYLIKWNATNFEFYIDGSTTPAATIIFTVNQQMYLQLSDVFTNDGALSVNWLRVTPYPASGSYISKVFDNGSAADWGAVSWNSTTPVGTAISILVRTGITATPDDTWSDYVAVDNGGNVGANSRYLQYLAALSTTDPNYTPVLKNIAIECTAVDNTAPLITSIGATSSADGISATINWTTNENANSKVDYGTEAGALAESIADVTMLTSHFLQLTGLTPGTTYHFRVTSADAATNSATMPNPPAVPLTFTTNAPPCFEDISLNDFSSGTTGNSTHLSSFEGGEVILKPVVAEEFSGSVLPAEWTQELWNPGGSTVFGSGKVSLNGSHISTNSSFGPGTSIEFVATFRNQSFQNIGFSNDFAFNDPWITVGIPASGGGIFARDYTGTNTLLLPASQFGVPHRYRIVWNASNFEFYVDNNPSPAATLNIAIPSNMVVHFSNFNVGQGLDIDWIHVTPLAASGIFESRIFDAGGLRTWGTISWTADVPTESNIQFEQRQGNNAVPDGTWTPFTPVAANGDIVGGTSRYIQYRANLSTTNPTQTPVLKDVHISCMAEVISCNMSLVESTTHVSCSGGNDGAIDLTVDSGTLPFTYNWSNGETTEDVDELSAGSYSVTVTDANGCTTTATITITQPGSYGQFTMIEMIPGAEGINPLKLTKGDDVLYFTADNGINGRELWKSGGTVSTTVQIADVNGVPDGSDPQELTYINGILFFTAPNAIGVRQLFYYNSMDETTTIVPGIYNPQYLTNVNGTLFFSASNIANTELYKLNGGNAELVKDISPGGGNSNPFGLINFNGILYFSADDGTTGIELWKSDGTDEGTVRVADINPGGSSTPAHLAAVNDTIYFSADDGTHGRELWKSNIVDGTVMVKDINPSGSSDPTELIKYNDGLYFGANDGVNGMELWKSDGTALNTVMAKNINTLAGFGSTPSNFTMVNGEIYFSAIAFGLEGNELWKTDMTNGAVLVKDINPGSVYSDPTNLKAVGTALLFSADDGTNGREIWQSDGTLTGTFIKQNIEAGAGSSDPQGIIEVNGKLFITAATAANGRELWVANNLLALEASITSQTNVLCNGNATGSATVTVTGGGGDYTYLWNTTPAQTSATATGLTAGSYTVTVTNANGCTAATTVTITQPPTLTLGDCSKTDATCNGTGSGSVSAGTVTNAVGTVSYSWKNASNVVVSTTPTVNNLAAGTYTLTVTDNCGTATCQVTVNQPPALLLGACVKTDATCIGSSTGSVSSGTVTNAVGTVLYSWKNAANVVVGTTAIVNNLPAGTYTLTVTDNCISRTCQVTVAQSATALGASITSQTNVKCRGNSTGLATVTPTGGTPGYTYLWNTTPAKTTATASNLAAGTYIVTVTDAKGCIKTATATITQPASALSAGNITMSPATPVAGQQLNTIYLGYGPQSATLSVSTSTVTGGTGSRTYSWSPAVASGGTTTSAVVKPTVTTTYTLTIRDANNCVITRTFTVKVIDARCGKKITVCHSGVNTCVTPDKVQSHLNHGDYLGPCSTVPTSVTSEKPAEEALIPANFNLRNYPNPFTGVTRILYEMPFASKVLLKVYDVSGREIATLVNADKKAGYHAVDFDGSKLSSGIYYYKFIANANGEQFLQTRKMTIMR